MRKLIIIIYKKMLINVNQKKIMKSLDQFVYQYCYHIIKAFLLIFMGTNWSRPNSSFLKDNYEFWQKKFKQNIPPQLEQSFHQIDALHGSCTHPQDGEQHVGQQDGSKGYVYKINESFYYGDILDSKAQGEGSIFYKDNTFYEGWFRNGQRHGNGKLAENNYSNLKLKIGSWVDDNFSSGQIFHYQQSNIQKIILVQPGKYKIKFSDNSIFQGEMKELQKGRLVKHGFGKLTIGDSYKYIGQFKDDLKDGENCVQQKTGNMKYQGSFKQDFKAKGKITYTIKDKRNKRAIMEKQGEWFESEKYFTGRVKFVSKKQLFYQRNLKKVPQGAQ